MLKAKTYQFDGKTIEISTGELALLSAGSVTLKLGETTVLVTTNVSPNESEQDFFPLSVEYIEKMYARGAIGGSRFQKREMFPSDEAILKARQIDHSIRSLFPKGFKKATSVIVTVLSFDEKNDPESLAVVGASLSLMFSGVPYAGPASSVVTIIDANGLIKVNPYVDEIYDSYAEMIVSGVNDKFLNIEGWAKEITNDQMDQLLLKSMEYIKQLNHIQMDFYKFVTGKDFVNEISTDLEYLVDKELIDNIYHRYSTDIRSALFVSEKNNRSFNIENLKQRIHKEWNDEHETVDDKTKFEINLAVEYIARKILRDAVLNESKRVSGRALDEIREISAKVDVVPYVHGSALFTRGLTQSLSIVTLGPLTDSLSLDDMEGESTKRFMHHYNFPPFSTGESTRYNYKPGRREIGHGAIGENALKNMIPTEVDFPYTIRVVSEILTSNGSTSMAATCASSMALMSAGVKLKSAVAGIGIGLVTEDGNDRNYKLLMDIEGIEDFYGDMDFKVAGTMNGITAIQYENKLRGVCFEIISDALRWAEKGRKQILLVMNEVIDKSRTLMSPNAPVVDKITIQKDKIGELIGPGGKNIRDIIDKSKNFNNKPCDINIQEDGTVIITAANNSQLEYVKDLITRQFAEPVVGDVYMGTVDKIMPYGVFVNVSSNISGLLHTSEMSSVNKNPDVEKIFQPGEKLNVKILKIENNKINFTLKGVINNADVMRKIDTLKTQHFRKKNNNIK